MKEPSRESLSLLQDFVAQQSENVFMKAFSFSSTQLPLMDADPRDFADRIALIDDIGFMFDVKQREPKVGSKPGDLEKWINNHVVRKGIKQIHSARELLRKFDAFSLVNGFGHRFDITSRKIDEIVSVILYRVPAKSKAFRAVRFKRSRDNGFVHVLRDTDYFEICQHFVTPAELHAYFNFRRDILVNWDPPSIAVSEAALIGQYLLEDFASPPDPQFERAALSRGGPTACEFAFVIDSLGSDIASQGDDYADTDCYNVLTEIALLARPELRALKQQLRLTLEAVRANRFELPHRVVSQTRKCGFVMLPVTEEFRDRAFDALASISLASKHELQLEKQVGIGMWKTGEFVDIEWTYIESENFPNQGLDDRLEKHYPFRRTSEKRLPPIFL